MTILDSAAQVLHCFGGDCTELTVTDLAARLGMPKSNASRLLRAMRDAGLLETVGETKRYRPGLLLVDAGRVYLRASSLIARADALVARVSARCGHTGYVSMRNGVEITAVTDYPGTNALHVQSTSGTRLPAFASATGRTLLARLGDAEVRRLYPTPLLPPTPQAPQDIEDLLNRLDEVRRRGYATSRDEYNRGVGAVAVAVGDPRHAEAVSLCISFPSATTDAAERRDILNALLDGAAEIGALTGDAVPARRSA